MKQLMKPLIELLAIRLSPQAGKWLVTRGDAAERTKRATTQSAGAIKESRVKNSWREKKRAAPKDSPFYPK